MTSEQVQYGNEDEVSRTICGQCVYLALPLKLRPLFLLGSELSEFLEFIWIEEDEKRFVCVLPLVAAVASPIFLVNVHDSYVPAFYKTMRGTASLSR